LVFDVFVGAISTIVPISFRYPAEGSIFAVVYYDGLRVPELGIIDVNDYHATYGRLATQRRKGSRGGEYHLTEVERSAAKVWLKRGARSWDGCLCPAIAQNLSLQDPPHHAEILRSCKYRAEKSPYTHTGRC
jgi:hypothetical protein